MIRLHRETSSTLVAGSLVTRCDDARKGHSWRDRVSGLPGKSFAPHQICPLSDGQETDPERAKGAH